MHSLSTSLKNALPIPESPCSKKALNLFMPERLIGRRLRPHVPHGHALVIRRRRPLVPALAQKRAVDAIVRVRGPFGARALLAAVPAAVVSLDLVAAAGAAAGAQEPKQARGPRKGNGDPEDDEDVVADRGVDVVFRQGVVEGGGEGGEEDGGSKGKAEDGGAADGRDDGGGKTSPAAEEGEHAHDHLNGGGDDGHDVRDEHPFRHGSIGFQAVVELFAKELVGG